MNLLDDIRADLVNESASLSNTLRKAKILASQINLPEFKEWLDFELSGYTDTSRVPNYRSLPATNRGTFSGSFGSWVKNMPIPVSHLPEPVREHVENLIIHEGVGTLEAMIKQPSKVWRKDWVQEAVIDARDSLTMTGNLVLVDAHQSISGATISGILDNVKNKLLDFILAMQESNITPENLDKGALGTRDVRNLFNINIYGDNNVVASGENVRQEVAPVHEGDVDSLLNHLREVGVDDNSLCELKEAVASEPSTADGNFGPKVRAWRDGILEKSASSAQKIGVEIVLDALKGFYGQ